MSNYNYLKKIPVFSDLSDEELMEINKIVLLRKYKKGTIIFMEGEQGNEVYFVKKGKVKLTNLIEDGREKILHFLKPGEIFAEVLLFDGGPFPATAEVIEDAEIGVIRNKDIEKIVLNNTEFAWKLLKVMAGRLREAQLHVRDLALRGMYGRLASTLQRLAEDYGINTCEGVCVNLNLSQQELADLIGSSRETVARILADFKKAGAIKVKRPKIIIVNKQVLWDWM